MTRDKNRGTFRYLLSFLTSNWGLKLLALLLSILIYETLKPTHDSSIKKHDRNILQAR